MHVVLIGRRLMFISITLLALNTSVTCQSVIRLMEGEVALLEFQYQCNASEVTLQHGYKAPFYRSINPQSIPLAPYPEERYKVENKVTSNGCSIYLTISPLQRNDAGTYITQVYKGGDVLPDMQRIGLNIDYPPGKAFCEWRKDLQVGMVGEWGLLQCKASIGSLSGQFECYQRGERVPPYTAPTQTHDKLVQTIWVRSSHPVFCCTSTQELPTEHCGCRDYIWGPLNDRKSNRTLEPCPTMIPDISTSQIPLTESVTDLELEARPSSIGSLATPSKTPLTTSERVIEETVSKLLKWAYGIGAMSFVLLVLCLISCIKLFHVSSQHKCDFV